MIRIRDEDAVRVITLDRPAQRNALTPEALDALESAVLECSQPVIYLHGAGEVFCAGADLNRVAELATTGEVAPFVRRGQRAAEALETTGAIVVAGIDGAVRGGGVELAVACDVRVATPDATFGEPGVTFGLFGAWGGTIRLPEVIGLGDALDFSLSGRVIDAGEAKHIGLISRIVETPRAVADSMASNDPQALTLLKERLRDRSPKPDQEAAEVAAFEALIEAHGDTLHTLTE